MEKKEIIIVVIVILLFMLVLVVSGIFYFNMVVGGFGFTGRVVQSDSNDNLFNERESVATGLDSG